MDYGAGEAFSEGFVVAVQGVISHYSDADEEVVLLVWRVIGADVRG